MDAARLPEVFDFKGSVVRSFPASSATGFPRLSQSERKRTPAVVRRLYKAAATHAAEHALCLICEAPAPVEGRIMIAVEEDKRHEFGCVCAGCSRLGELER